MTMVVRNNNRAMAAATAQAIPAIGAIAFSATGKKLIFDGIKYVAAKGAQFVKDKWNNRNKGKDMVAHPGAFPGSVAAPVAISRLIRGSRPKFIRSKGAVTITHRELVAQINSTSNLTVNGGVTGNLYKLNPSNPNLFPWLQTIAANFDQYRFNNVRLSYVPMCSTTDTGRTALYFDKDSQDSEPADRVELANMLHLVETAPWGEAALQIPVDNIKRFVDDSATTDRKMIDLGQIGFAVYGGGGITAFGDLFIHYTVTFYEPQPSAGLIETIQEGAGLPTIGPRLVQVGATSTTTTITFRSAGVYLVVLAQRSVTLIGVTPIGLTFNSNTTANAGGFYIAVYNVTVPNQGAAMQFVGTGFSTYDLQVTRAKVTNTAQLP